MRPPEDLYQVHREPSGSRQPILVHAFSGFVDAGAGVRLASAHILQTCDHELIATFDVDEVLDYRARRPRMTFDLDHFSSVEIPSIDVHEVVDGAGNAFLLAVGPEPDYQWRRFITAMDGLVERFGVRMAVGLSAIPWPAPHTRPLGLTMHGNASDIIAGRVAAVGQIEVPGHIEAMLEFHLGQRIPSIGITAQVPHYLVQFEYPQAAQALLSGLASACGLLIGSQGLAEAAARADQEITDQLADNEEFRGVVTALEMQADQAAALASSAGGEHLPVGEVPTGDEIAAQVERFLAGLSDDQEQTKEP
ncbi:MAG: PAC2 family protein [Actinomycetales bacterium]|nr:PAC2 family protein [Actinomycetales bacterium]